MSAKLLHWEHELMDGIRMELGDDNEKEFDEAFGEPVEYIVPSMRMLTVSK
ncbi:MAG: hypothetical protein R3C03_00625 [Pirellulaceae bacterium]